MKKLYFTVLAALMLLGTGCTTGLLGNMGMGSGTGNESGNGANFKYVGEAIKVCWADWVRRTQSTACWVW